MIGKNIKEIRKLRGLSLSELAERANISKSYLSNIERDLNKNPSIKVIKKIAGVLEVDLKTLIKSNSNEDGMQPFPDKEWLELLDELKETGLDKNNIKDYKMLLEFIRWQNRSKINEES